MKAPDKINQILMKIIIYGIYKIKVFRIVKIKEK